MKINPCNGCGKYKKDVPEKYKLPNQCNGCAEKFTCLMRACILRKGGQCTVKIPISKTGRIYLCPNGEAKHGGR
jgi:hypothetical protein